MSADYGWDRKIRALRLRLGGGRLSPLDGRHRLAARPLSHDLPQYRGAGIFHPPLGRVPRNPVSAVGHHPGGAQNALEIAAHCQHRHGAAAQRAAGSRDQRTVTLEPGRCTSMFPTATRATCRSSTRPCPTWIRWNLRHQSLRRRGSRGRR